MQIKAIILYSHDGRRRVLPLQPGKVNIITGRSATGKSALISIVEYCLGGKSEIAGQVIRDHVAWYALHLQYETSQVFLARRDPGAGQENSDHFYLEGEEVEVPDTIEAANTNTSAVQDLLTSKLGIPLNLHTPIEGQTRAPVSATIRHALLLCFQEQDEIATRKRLFHRQDEFWRMQHFRDTLPVFLGVVEDDAVVLEQQLREERRALRSRRQKLLDEQNLRGDGIGRAIRLISEARDVGLLAPEFNESLTDLDGVMDALRRILDWEPQTVPLEQGGDDAALRADLERLDGEERRLREELSAVEILASSAGEHDEVIGEQVVRLQSIGLYPAEFEHAACPVCNSPLETPLPTTDDLQDALQKLKNSLAHLQSDRPQLLDYLKQIQDQRRDIRKSGEEVREQLEGIYQARQSTARLRDDNLVRSRVVGRISLWLESAEFSNDLAGLEREIKEREGRVEALEGQLNPEAKQQRLGALLSQIGTRMTEWARRLQLEHADEGLIRLDLAKLTIVADKGARSTELAQIGSGQNWLGYHLVVHLALHAFLTEADRPTPRFLFLDQPTQVYFPAESEQRTRIEETGDLEPLTDDDHEAVQRVFGFLFDVVEQLGGKFQVIVSDHANLKDDDRFQAAIVEEWRGDQALIPADWLTAATP